MAALLLLAAIGIFALLYFWTQLLKPGNLGTLSLPVVAFVAGLAATFNPCALPALPAFLTLMSAGDMPSPTSSRMQRKTRGGNLGRSRLALDLSTGLGAIALVLLLGLLVSLLGESTKAFVRDNFRWVQLSVGLFLVVIAGLHLLGQTTRLPFVAPLVAKGHQIWEDAVRDPSPRGGFLFGAGYVLVGVG